MNKIINFIREAKEELKKVDWPSKKKTISYTLAVVEISIAVAVFLGVLDLIFSSVIEKFIF